MKLKVHEIKKEMNTNIVGACQEGITRKMNTNRVGVQGNNALEIKMCHCAKYESINMKCEC